MNPLIGPNRDAFGPRFPAMSDAYDFDLRLHAFRAAIKLGFKKGTMIEGIYAWVAGPVFETRAEQKFLRAAGATVVGMSTVPEVIIAHHAVRSFPSPNFQPFVGIPTLVPLSTLSAIYRASINKIAGNAITDAKTQSKS
jgi:hypothetical protein